MFEFKIDCIQTYSDLLLQHNITVFKLKAKGIHKLKGVLIGGKKVVAYAKVSRPKRAYWDLAPLYKQAKHKKTYSKTWNPIMDTMKKHIKYYQETMS